jgi:hypothetical protein
MIEVSRGKKKTFVQAELFSQQQFNRRMHSEGFIIVQKNFSVNEIDHRVYFSSSL